MAEGKYIPARSQRGAVMRDFVVGYNIQAVPVLYSSRAS